MPIPDKYLKELHNNRRRVRGGMYLENEQIEKNKRYNQIFKNVNDLLTSSAILSLSIWNIIIPEHAQPIVLAIIAAFAAIIGWVRTSLNLPAKIENSSNKKEKYRLIDSDFNKLVFEIERNVNLDIIDFSDKYSTMMLKLDVSELLQLEARFSEKILVKLDEELPKDGWKLSYIAKEIKH